MRTRGLVAMLVPLAWLGLAAPAGAEEARYSMEDLKALAAQEGWAELIAHVGDVAPAKRDKEWNGLLERATLGLLGTLEVSEELSAGLATVEQLLLQYPVLKKAAAIMQKRAAIGLQAFAECFEKNSYDNRACITDLERFLKVDPANRELAFEAGKLVRRRGSSSYAVHFFLPALQGKKNAAWCADVEVAEAVSRAFGQPPDQAESKAAAEIAFRLCWKELEGGLVEKFYQEGGGTLGQVMCPELKAKGLLKGFRAAFCQDLK